MGWGEARPTANGGAGTSGQIEQALAALEAVGITGPNLALAATTAAGALARLREAQLEADAVMKPAAAE